jgi:ribosomal protein S18 acetylase RimI-like enzyme
MSTATIQLRDYRPADKAVVDHLVAEAWHELAHVLPGWLELASRLGTLTDKAHDSEVIVAERDGRALGAVGYVGPGQGKQDFFDPRWPVVRFLSVAPQGRGQGIGQLLLDECLARARRDQAPLMALHTTPLMAAAQKLYLRAGFKVQTALPDMFGAPFVLMVKPLAGPPEQPLR